MTTQPDATPTPLVSQAQIGDIAEAVDTENGYLQRTGDPLVVGMMVNAMTRLQAIYEADRAKRVGRPTPPTPLYSLEQLATQAETIVVGRLGAHAVYGILKAICARHEADRARLAQELAEKDEAVAFMNRVLDTTFESDKVELARRVVELEGSQTLLNEARETTFQFLYHFTSNELPPGMTPHYQAMRVWLDKIEGGDE